MTLPVTLFAFNRPEHVRQTLNALAQNARASDVCLLAYLDGPKTDHDVAQIARVREIVAAPRGFARIELIERPANLGLARNIVDGVSQSCARFGRAIVLEDDIVTAPHFLTFMADALERYRDVPDVWHISGWNYPISEAGLADAFFYPVMDCWGWATWEDRWRHYQCDPARLLADWDRRQIHRFNLDGSEDFWAQVRRNHSGSLHTWAIFWYATIFEHGGLCLNPTRSYVRNIGIDGSGQHSGNRNVFDSALAEAAPLRWPAETAVDSLAVARIRNFLRETRPSLTRRLASAMKWRWKDLRAERQHRRQEPDRG